MGACDSYFRGDADDCPKVLMTDQIKCLATEAKCVEDWTSIYQDKPAAPEYKAELLSLECVRLGLRVVSNEYIFSW